jgi:hypothetical protein
MTFITQTMCFDASHALANKFYMIHSTAHRYTRVTIAASNRDFTEGRRAPSSGAASARRLARQPTAIPSDPRGDADMHVWSQRCHDLMNFRDPLQPT